MAVRTDARQHRRGKVVGEFYLALKRVRELAGKSAIAVKPPDLIFILDRHQLEQIPRDRLAQRGRTRHDMVLGLPHHGDASGIMCAIGFVLIVGQKRRTPRDHLVKAGGELQGRRARHGLGRRLGYGFRLEGGFAAPGESRKVHRHRLAIQSNGPHDRI